MQQLIQYATAGGVVINARRELLALARVVIRARIETPELRLPKGHIDPGETPEAAAVREVGEESGYWRVGIVADLGLLHSSFVYDGMRYERDEHYFLMRLDDERREAPQPVSAEEALFEPRWLPLNDASARLTYPTECDAARRARLWITAHGWR